MLFLRDRSMRAGSGRSKSIRGSRGESGERERERRWKRGEGERSYLEGERGRVSVRRERGKKVGREREQTDRTSEREFPG